MGVNGTCPQIPKNSNFKFFENFLEKNFWKKSRRQNFEENFVKIFVKKIVYVERIYRTYK